MDGFHFIIREYFGSIPFNLLGLFFYVLLLILLIKQNRFKTTSFYIMPFFSIYFGLVVANLFGIFLNGNDSSLITRNEAVTVMIVEAFIFFWEGTKVLYGGYFGSLIGIFVFCILFKKKSYLSTLFDISAIGISLLFAMWRLSCFTGGCCYGVPSETLGINFAKYSSAYVHLMNTALILPDGSATVPLIPTQLISSVANFLIFLFLLTAYLKNGKRPYFVFFMHMLLYGGFRFIIEFFRKDPREFWGPLSISQWIFIAMLPFILSFFLRNKPKKNQ